MKKRGLGIVFRNYRVVRRLRLYIATLAICGSTGCSDWSDPGSHIAR